MSISILNNTASMAATNQLSMTSAALQKTLLELSSGSRINSGADDAAGLSIANGLQANVTALTQSARNATDGIGQLQVADGALSQVTTLLNRAVTLATEASTGTINDTQRGSLDAEFTQIKSEIDRIGSKTNFNGVNVFSGSTTVNDTNLYTGATGSLTAATSLATAGNTLSITDTDTGNQYTYTVASGSTVGDLITQINSQTAAGTINVQASLDSSGKLQIKDLNGNHSLFVTSNIGELGTVAASTTTANAASVFISDGGTSTTLTTNINALSSSALSLTSDSLTSAAGAQSALTDINAAIGSVASQRGTIGAMINRLQSAGNVMQNQIQNLSSSESNITSADISQAVADLTKYNVLQSTGITALSQSNQMTQSVLKLLQ